MRRLASIGLVVAAISAAVVLAGASSKSSQGRTYKVVFDNAFGLVEGGDFRVGGVTAGKTTDFSISKKKGHSPKAVVTAKITKTGLDDFREDASCEIRPQSLIGEYFVDCQPGNSRKKLPTDGNGTVPVEHTSSSVPVDLVQDILRRPYRERFRLIVDELGTGLAGRPDDLQEVVHRAHPGLRETSKVLRILGDQNAIIENFIRDSDTVVGELERNKQDVVRWVQTAGRTAEISATRREALAQNFQKLPTFLAELRLTMAALERLTDEQTPLLADLNRAAPSLRIFFTRLGPFSKASLPALRALGRASVVGRRTFKEGAEEIAALKTLAPKAQPTFKPLRQFLQTMDDRKRAIDEDARAKVNGPPASDPSYEGGRGGFTGFEALWNYPFWQGLSLNGFDNVGHMLRISITLGECSPLINKVDPNSDLFKHCTQWLGDNLPGITTGDFSDNGSILSKLRREAKTPAKRIGERRSAGQPDAAPLPGQKDISKPQIVLPPKVQKLLDQLKPKPGRGGVPQLPLLDQLQRQLRGGAPGASSPSPGDSANQLLDFLLAQ